MISYDKKQKVTEMIVGMNRDPNFGPMIMVGMGGIFANYMKDVSFALGFQYTEKLALEQLKKTKVWPILEGVRGQQKSAVDELIRSLVKMSQLVDKYPDINELDLNPILVFSEAEGLNAIDVKIVLKDPNAVTEAPAHHE